MIPGLSLHGVDASLSRWIQMGSIPIGPTKCAREEQSELLGKVKS